MISYSISIATGLSPWQFCKSVVHPFFHNLKMNLKFLIPLVLLTYPTLGQKKTVQFQHVEPPFWWIGMKNTSLQILFYNKEVNISEYTASLTYPGVSLKEVKKVSNPHYLFLTIDISSQAKVGTVPIQFVRGKKKFDYSYELKSKEASSGRIQGFNSSDVVYL